MKNIVYCLHDKKTGERVTRRRPAYGNKANADKANFSTTEVVAYVPIDAVCRLLNGFTKEEVTLDDLKKYFNIPLD